MIDFYKVFDYKIARTHCEDEQIYKSPAITAGLDKLFSDPNLCPCLDDQNGEGVSTFRLKDYFLFKDVDGIEPFKEWFEKQVSQYLIILANLMQQELHTSELGLIKSIKAVLEMFTTMILTAMLWQYSILLHQKVVQILV